MAWICRWNYPGVGRQWCGEEQDVDYSLDSERHRVRRVSTLKKRRIGSENLSEARPLGWNGLVEGSWGWAGVVKGLVKAAHNTEREERGEVREDGLSSLSLGVLLPPPPLGLYR